MAKRTANLPVTNPSIGRNPLDSFPAPSRMTRAQAGNSSGNVPIPTPSPIPAKGSPRAGKGRSPRSVK